jgi:hypothetical protein
MYVSKPTELYTQSESMSNTPHGRGWEARSNVVMEMRVLKEEGHAPLAGRTEAVLPQSHEHTCAGPWSL